MNNINIRSIVFKILTEVFYKEKKLNDEIENSINHYKITDSVDKAFIKKECTGIIENIETLDENINKFSKTKTNKLDNDILIILRIGFYELIYMSKIGNYATVNECVKLTKTTKSRFLDKYVNAVLRSATRELDLNADESGEKRCYFRIFNDGLDIVLKELNDKKINYYEYDGALSFKFAKVFYTSNYKDILELDSFANGYILIQDASSIFLTDKLCEYIKGNNKRSDSIKILDTCSSPGGKILGLVDLLKSDFKNIEAISHDISTNKTDKINENIKRLKAKNINTSVNDATEYIEKYDKYFDIVICDVPCSGLGVIDKKPDIKLKTTDDKIASLVELQTKILNVSKKYVKVDGLLSYSTCTETKEENENNIEKFLNENSNFEKAFEKSIKHNDDNNCDGFYFALLNRKS